MAVLVDEAIWPWRGARWAHLVSDRSLDELHDFAHRLGVPYLAFQGDHYDVHAELRARAVAAGARAVPGRELVAALRAAGLRRRSGVDPWRWGWRVGLDELDPAGLPGELADHVVSSAEGLAARAGGVELGVAGRDGESLLVVSSDHSVPVDAGLTELAGGVRWHRSSGERGTFLEWQLPGRVVQMG